MYLKYPKLFVCIFSFLLSFGLQAQPTCIGFGDIPLGTSFGQSAEHTLGDTVLRVKEVIVSVERFAYSNTEITGFGDASIVDWAISDFGGDNPYLFISNINMVFDFSMQEGPVSEVYFDFVDGGGEENIAVNGHPIHVFRISPRSF